MIPLWDRAASAYLDEWSPRFSPYHVDLVSEVGVAPAKSVLVACSGPGLTAIAAARAVGEGGRVRVVDPSAEMVAVCMQRVGAAGVSATVTIERADAKDTSGGPWDAVLCGFGLSELPQPDVALSAWADGLAPHGKVGILMWGPLEPQDPHLLLLQAMAELEPNVAPFLSGLRPILSGPDQAPIPSEPRLGRRDVAALCESSGLVLARHTTVQHDLMFRTAEQFAIALRRACSWRAGFDALGETRTGKVLARFYDAVGGPEKPLVYQPTATIAVAALPGAEIELPHRPSVRLPAAK